MADLKMGRGCGPGAWWVEECGQAIVFPAEARAGLEDPKCPEVLREAAEEVDDYQLASAIAFAVFHQFLADKPKSLVCWGCDEHARGFHYHFARKGE